MDAWPQVDGVRHSWIELRDLRLHVAEAGEGRPLVLLHGWPQHWYEWRHLVPRLSSSYRLIFPDLRGFGWSDAPPAGYEKEQLATDVVALMDALGLERVGLVGHDWGGWVGYLLALHHPDRFERYLALNIIHPWQRLSRALPHLWRFWYQWVIISPGLGQWLMRTQPGILRALLRAGVSNSDLWQPEELDAFVDRISIPARAHASVQLYRTW